MKINLTEFICEYGKVIPLATARKGNRSFTLVNKSRFVIKKWDIDKINLKGCEDERCDHIFEVQANKMIYYWIELKGKDLTKACKQVLSTLNIIVTPQKVQHEARIITTGINKNDLRSNEYKHLDRVMRGSGGSLRQHTMQAIEVI